MSLNYKQCYNSVLDFKQLKLIEINAKVTTKFCNSNNLSIFFNVKEHL